MKRGAGWLAILGLVAACGGQTSSRSAGGSGGSASVKGGTERDAGGMGNVAAGGAGSTRAGGATSSSGAFSNGGVSGGESSSGGTSSGIVASGSGECTAILESDQDTGFDNCLDGTRRRRKALACPTPPTSAKTPCLLPTCSSDADCTREPLGYCTESRRLTVFCGCYYGCQSDADCGQGSLCECQELLGTCVAAMCKSNADCAPGSACVVTRNGDGGPACSVPSSKTYACLTPADECVSDADCRNQTGALCLFNGGHRVCGLVCPPPF